jgi:predicted CXXCH cytochrome family protein
MRRRQQATWLACAILLAPSLLPSTALGGDWHKGPSLRCSDCHTMHNSQRGQPMRYDLVDAPAEALLRADSSTSLCLACHSGRGPSPTAPNVLLPTNWDPPGGGFPADLTDPLGHAHSMGPGAVLPPQGSTPVTMTCLACHDAHGTGGYRNLRPSPSTRGTAVQPPVARQTVVANGTNPDLVYLRANVVYVSGMSQWCMDCHDQVSTTHVSGGGSLLASHPWDRTIGSGSASIPNRTAVQNALGLPPPNDTDQVVCLSCHKGHGSPNPAALLYADGLTMSSTCQQCHNQ